jgi:hypothetical protein
MPFNCEQTTLPDNAELQEERRVISSALEGINPSTRHNHLHGTIIEIKEVTKEAVNVALRKKKTDDTPIERGMEEKIFPAVKTLLGDSGILGERAS